MGIICKVVAKLTDDKLAKRLSLAAKSCFSHDQLRRLPNLNCSENARQQPPPKKRKCYKFPGGEVVHWY